MVGRILKAIGYAVVLLALTFGFSEFAARFLYDFDPPTPTRTLVPYAGTGNFHAVRSVADLIDSPDGPVSFGYREGAGIFYYAPDGTPARASDVTDFVLGEQTFSLHPIGEFESDPPGMLRIFVIGGSAARGSGASGRSTTWFSHLETRLRAEFGPESAKIYLGAMGAFVSTQERLVFDWSVAPRRPDIVIDLNGFNDVFTPLAAGVRPGHPLQMARHYGEYSRDWAHLLTTYSAVSRALLRQHNTETLLENHRRVLADPALAATVAASIRDIYVDNMRHMLDRCADIGADCFVLLQPYRELTDREAGRPPFAGDSRFPHLTHSDFYYVLYKSVAATMRDEAGFRDLSGVFNASGDAPLYKDIVHFNDAGHRILADAVYPLIRAAVQRRIAARTAAPGGE